MSRGKALALFGLGTLAFVLFGWWGVPRALDLTRRGRRLTVTKLNDDKSIPEGPHELALLASAEIGRHIDTDMYAVARMLRSEEPGASPEVKGLLVHVALNTAKQRGVTLAELLTTSTVASRRGKFGRQISRWASTANDPYEQDVAIAELARDERRAGSDPTGGAFRFVNRLAFGIQPGSRSYGAVRAEWAAEGFYPVKVPGAPWRLVFFRRGDADADPQAVA
jgi:hypothetical protein